MSDLFLAHINAQLDELKRDGLFKSERVIASPQSGAITLASDESLLNFCANNYLGLADDSELIQAAQTALDNYGYGMASVRFICGTQSVHKQLEARLSAFTRMPECILYSSCFDANTGLFEALLDERDAILSDELNHASIIDGVRLCKARRYRYRNNDMDSLRECLVQTADARFRLIATDGVFSMDGVIADLKSICDLARRFDAMVMVDDSHAIGVVGADGRGTVQHCGVEGEIDIVTGTLGKALGGASGGYTCARGEIVEYLRQRSRPYLFSNTLAPVIAATSLRALDLIEGARGGKLRARLRTNAERFRCAMSALGFELRGGAHPIIPVMLGDAELAQRFAAAMSARGIYVTAFAHPVVPHGAARIRVQMSAAHNDAQLDRAIAAFAEVGRELGVIPDR